MEEEERNGREDGGGCSETGACNETEDCCATFWSEQSGRDVKTGCEICERTFGSCIAIRESREEHWNFREYRLAPSKVQNPDRAWGYLD